jgi:hypothetical protein
MPYFTAFVNDNAVAAGSRDDFMMGIVKRDFGLIVVTTWRRTIKERNRETIWLKQIKTI